MSSIKQYRGKTWRAIVRRKGFAVQSKTFALKREAEAWAAAVEAKMGVSEYDKGQIKAAKVLTVRAVFERYIKEVGPAFRGRNEIGTLTRLVRDAHFMPYLLSNIQPRDIRDWRDARSKEVQPQSVNREFNSISGVFRHAIKEWGLPLALNPCHAVSQFKGADKARNATWSPGDVQTFLKAANWNDASPGTGRDYVGWALLLALETAMRIGELCLPVVSDYYRSGCRLHLAMTKNGSARDVPLSTAAIKLLDTLVAGKQPTEKIFPLKANTLGEYVLDVRRACGLEHLMFHDTRHSAATMLSTKLANVLELSAVTGHKSLRSLQRYYHPDAKVIAGKLG